MNIYKTHNCGELRINNVNENVRLAGFVQTIRNLGKMTFIDSRDENGITQIVISNEAELVEQFKDVTKECTVTISGIVVERSSKNEKIPTGEIEVIAKDIKVLGKCKASLPFEIRNEIKEQLRYWQFERADYSANAKFDYNIKIK